MANPTINIAAAIAANDDIVDLIDIGSGTAEGRLKIYAGAQPAGPDVAIGAQTLLGTLNMSNPAFGASSDNAPNARATASAITDDSSADATDTAAFFRVEDRDGNGIIDGDITASAGGGDLELNTVSIVTGATISVTAFTFDHLEA